MARIELAPEILRDFDRFVDHLLQFDATDAQGRVAEIIDAVQVLAHSPLIGRPVRGRKRELVVGRRLNGFVILYRYVESLDTVFLLAARGQREAAYHHER